MKARNPNIEIRNNIKARITKIQNLFWILGFWICFGFRYSDFGFKY